MKIKEIADFAPPGIEAGAGLALQDEAGRYLFFLAGKRHHCPPGELFYAGIGGHREHGESWMDCIQREAREEIGVQVEVLSAPHTWVLAQTGDTQKLTLIDQPTPLALYEMKHPAGTPRQGEIYRLVIYQARLLDIPLDMPPDEIQGVIALTPEQVHLGPQRKPTLEKLLAEGAEVVAGAENVDRQTRLYPLGTARALAYILTTTGDGMSQSNYNPDWVAGHFDQLGDQEWERLVATPVDEVSLHIHTHYLKKYITAGDRVLEIGAGAGRFTQVLADIGARVLVADISPGQLSLNQQYAHQLGFARAVEDWQRVDICDLSCFQAGSFDQVVAYGGPLSYVFDRRDDALAECLHVLKPGGRLLFSVMSLWGSAHRALGAVLDLSPEQNRQIIESGDILPGSFAGVQHFMHMFRAAELRSWLEGSGLELLALSASNSLSTGWEEPLAKIKSDPEKWSRFLDTELEACAEPGCLDMGTHLIAVAQSEP